MRVDEAASPSGYTLSLADGTRWLVRAGDVQTEEIVSALGATMCLQPGNSGRELLAVVRKAGGIAPVNLDGPGPALCILPPLSDDDTLTVGMSRLARVVAREAQSRGGLLLHGALAETPSGHCVTASREIPVAGTPGPARRSAQPAFGAASGILLAGPGTVGKSTASRRLPRPWRARCDDAALVVCDSQGGYWAHPWPTWSQFYGCDAESLPGGCWDVQRAVPLRAIFFLSQSPADRVESLSVSQATAMLMETVQHVSGPMARYLSEAEVWALHREQLAAAEALARAVPAFTLYLSLTGAFWEEVERVLAETPSPPAPLPARERGVTPLVQVGVAPSPPGGEGRGEGGIFTANPPLDGSILHVVYTGRSMTPSLIEPELLEVRPYHDRLVRPGDVVYLQPPGEQQKLVHRVATVIPPGTTPGSIRTRGDNSSAADPFILQPADIVGQVVAAQRNSRRRRIAGGLLGVLVGTVARLRRTINRSISRMLHGAYRTLARTGLLRNLLPVGLRPRVFTFQTRERSFLKLMMAGRVVGQYDTRERQWRIRRPFRLFVDEDALPYAGAGQGLAPGETSTLSQAD